MNAADILIIATAYDAERLRRAVEPLGRVVHLADGGSATEASLPSGRYVVILALRLGRYDARKWLDRFVSEGRGVIVVGESNETVPAGATFMPRPVDAYQLQQAVKALHESGTRKDLPRARSSKNIPKPEMPELSGPPSTHDVSEAPESQSQPSEISSSSGTLRGNVVLPPSIRDAVDAAASIPVSPPPAASEALAPKVTTAPFPGGSPAPTAEASQPGGSPAGPPPRRRGPTARWPAREGTLDLDRDLAAPSPPPKAHTPPPSPPSPPSIDSLDLDALDQPDLRGIETDSSHAAAVNRLRPTTEPELPVARRTQPVPPVGDLRTYDVATLIGHLYRQGFTGRLTLRRGDIEKCVFFDDGLPVSCTSNLPADRLGDRLLRDGLISRMQYDEAGRRAADTSRRMGAVLLEMQAVGAKELFAALRRHHEGILVSLFGWEEGTYALDASEPSPSDRVRLDKHPTMMVVDGIVRKYSADRLTTLLGSSWCVFARVPELINSSELSAEHRIALGWFDGTASLEQIAERAGLDRVKAMALSWGFLAFGWLRHADGENPRALPRADRARIMAMHALVREGDYFTLLGVPRDADAGMVRRAYESLSAAFTLPHDGVLQDLTGEIESIHECLVEAFLVLGDDARRDAYRRAIETP